MKGQNNRNDGSQNNRKNKKYSEHWTRDAQERAEAIKYARHLRSQGLYAWADNWDRYAKAPQGTPKPPNYHYTPSSFSDGSTDPRMNTYPGTIYNQFGGDDKEYSKFMSKVTNPTGTLNSGGCGYSSIDPNLEKSNAELGKILDAKGRPYLLLKKLGELRNKYPQIYYHPNSQVF